MSKSFKAKDIILANIFTIKIYNNLKLFSSNDPHIHNLMYNTMIFKCICDVELAFHARI